MKELVDHILGKVPVQVLVGVVSEVDKDNLTCTVTPEGMAPFTEVRIRSLIDGEQKGIVAIPTENSLVLVGLIANNDASAFIVKYSKVDEFYITLENGFKFHLKDDGTATINGDSLGGLTITPELKDQLEKMTNRIDIALQLLKGVESCTLYPSGTWAATYNAATVSMQKEDFSNIENEKIKHGN